MIKAIVFGNISVSESVKNYIGEKYNPAAKKVGAEEIEVVCFSYRRKQKREMEIGCNIIIFFTTC